MIYILNNLFLTMISALLGVRSQKSAEKDSKINGPIIIIAGLCTLIIFITILIAIVKIVMLYT